MEAAFHIRLSLWFVGKLIHKIIILLKVCKGYNAVTLMLREHIGDEIYLLGSLGKLMKEVASDVDLDG